MAYKHNYGKTDASSAWSLLMDETAMHGLWLATSRHFVWRGIDLPDSALAISDLAKAPGGSPGAFMLLKKRQSAAQREGLSVLAAGW
jgi:hypothetical protein